MIICGIDYSLTSPAITIHEGTEWNIANCKFYYFVYKEKQLVTSGQFYGTMYPEYLSDPHRYENLSDWSLDIIKKNKVDSVCVEGYAFGAVGRVFQIAENAGLLKYKVWKEKIPCQVFAPAEIKKYATGKGNATKEKMYDAFLEETAVDIRKKLDIMRTTQWNPLSDIVDSYYIAKLGFVKEKANENHS